MGDRGQTFQKYQTGPGKPVIRVRTVGYMHMHMAVWWRPDSGYVVGGNQVVTLGLDAAAGWDRLRMRGVAPGSQGHSAI